MANLNQLHRVKHGYKFGEALLLFMTDNPYIAAEWSVADLDSAGIGSMAVTATGKAWLKARDSNNSILDWDEMGKGSSGDFLSAADHIADQAGDTAAQTVWAGLNPAQDETFLDTQSGILYRGNETGTPDLLYTAADLDNLRIAIKNQSTIYLGDSAGSLMADSRDGTAGSGSFLPVQNEEGSSKGAIFRYDGSEWEKISDYDWANWAGVTVGDGYTKATAEEEIATTDTGQEAAGKLEHRLDKERTITEVTLSSASKTALLTVPLADGEDFTRHFSVKILKQDSEYAYFTRLDVLAYRVLANSAIDTTGEYGIMELEPAIPDSAKPNITAEIDASHNVTLYCELMDYASGNYDLFIKETTIG
ncbi:MAG: hypothetical protein F6K39_14835 [Okeania sp. SIO3B3]|nr:hypothetical protein [Okeania sp. SIO3B3]